jgi:hypothetical protein
MEGALVVVINVLGVAPGVAVLGVVVNPSDEVESPNNSTKISV